MHLQKKTLENILKWTQADGTMRFLRWSPTIRTCSTSRPASPTKILELGCSRTGLMSSGEFLLTPNEGNHTEIHPRLGTPAFTCWWFSEDSSIWQTDRGIYLLKVLLNLYERMIGGRRGTLILLISAVVPFGNCWMNSTTAKTSFTQTFPPPKSIISSLTSVTIDKLLLFYCLLLFFSLEK